METLTEYWSSRIIYVRDLGIVKLDEICGTVWPFLQEWLNVGNSCIQSVVGNGEIKIMETRIFYK